MSNWMNLFKPFLDLWFKPNCVLCDRPAPDIVCKYCQGQLQQCQFTKPEQFWRQEEPSLFVWGAYQGHLKRAIAQIKLEGDRNCPQLAKPLGQWLAKAWLNSPVSQGKKLTVVPIPSDPQRLKERGFNQAELLAKGFCDLTGYPLQPLGLIRSRQTQALYSLSRQQRQQELSQAISLGPAFRRRRPRTAVLLLDDIYTTGTTCRESYKVLKHYRIPVYGIVAIATSKK